MPKDSGQEGLEGVPEPYTSGVNNSRKTRLQPTHAETREKIWREPTRLGDNTLGAEAKGDNKVRIWDDDVA